MKDGTFESTPRLHIPLFFSQEMYVFTFDVALSNQETPNPFCPSAPPFEVDLWISIETKNRNERNMNKRKFSKTWVESIIIEDGKVHQVKCKVCSKIERKDKLLAPKLDNFWKHSGRKKA